MSHTSLLKIMLWNHTHLAGADSTMQAMCNSSKLRESRHEACYIFANLKLQHFVSWLLLLPDLFLLLTLKVTLFPGPLDSCCLVLFCWVVCLLLRLVQNSQPCHSLCSDDITNVGHHACCMLATECLAVWEPKSSAFLCRWFSPGFA